MADRIARNANNIRRKLCVGRSVDSFGDINLNIHTYGIATFANVREDVVNVWVSRARVRKGYVVADSRVIPFGAFTTTTEAQAIADQVLAAADEMAREQVRDRLLRGRAGELTPRWKIPAHRPERHPMTLTIPLRQIDPDLPVPRRAHDGDAGVDLYAAHDVRIDAGGRTLIRTGIAVALPPGTVGLIHPRSGLAAKYGVTVLNAPGTVDAGYRGEIRVCLHNTDHASAFTVQRGDRIAQLVVQRVELPEFALVDSLDDTNRAADGFGSTGGHEGLEGEA